MPGHTFGFGFGLGGGYRWASTSVGDFSLPALNLLDIDFFIPVNGSFEMQIWIPLFGVILQNVIQGPGFEGDLVFKIYPRGDGGGFFIGPGLGFTYVALRNTSASGEELRLPIRIGYEVSSASGLTFAITGELSFNFYSTRR